MRHLATRGAAPALKSIGLWLDRNPASEAEQAVNDVLRTPSSSRTSRTRRS